MRVGPADGRMGVLGRAFLSVLLLSALLLCVPSDELPRIAAASSLQSVLPTLIAQWGGEVEVTYGASGTLQRQIEFGAPVEAVAFAALAPLADLEARVLMMPESRRLLARNQLVLVGAETGSSRIWRSLEGLADMLGGQVGEEIVLDVPSGSGD